METSRSSDRFHVLALLAGQVLWIANELGQVVEDLPTWRAFTGQCVNAIVNDGWMDALHPDDREHVGARLNRALAGKKPFEMIYRLRHRSGEYRHMQAQHMPVLAPDGTVSEWIGLGSDTTGQAEEDDKRRLALAMETIGDGMIILDREGQIQQSNAAANTILALDRAPPGFFELSSEERMRAYHIHDAAGNPLSFKQWIGWRVLSEGRATTGTDALEAGLTTFDGRDIDISVSGAPLRDAMGQVDGAVIIFRDITQHKQMEQSLRESEQRYRALFDRVVIGIAQITPAGQFLTINQRFCDLLGYSSDELMDTTLFGIMHPGDRSAVQKSIGRLLAGKVTAFGVEQRCLHKDGIELWVQLSLSYVRDGDPPYFICTMKDLSDRRRLEAQERLLQDTRDRYMLLQRVLDELPSAVYLVRGNNARLVLANREARAIWGAQWAVGQPFTEFLAAHGTRIYRSDGQPLPTDQLGVIIASRTGTEVRDQLEIVRTADGKSMPIVASAVPFDGTLLRWTDPDTSGRIERGSLVVVQDATAQREAERIKEEFIAIATHELRSPIAVLKGYAQLFQATLQKGLLTADQIEMLEAIDQAAIRLVALTDDLLDVTRIETGKVDLHVEPVDLVSLVRRMAQRHQILTQHHRLLVHSRAERIIVQCDPLRSEQVVSNLISNAIKYSPNGGPIHLVLRNTRGNNMALLAIRDRGIGIPIEQQTNIFGRFARANNARALGISGTGLGLYLCRELIEQQGGSIWFVSAPERGTTFFIAFPLAVTSDGDASDLASREQEMEDTADPWSAAHLDAAAMLLDDASAEG